MGVFQGDVFQGGGVYQVDEFVPDPATLPKLQVWIDNVDRTAYVRDVRNLDLTYTAGARGVFRFEVYDPESYPAGSATDYRPQTEQSIVAFWDGVRVFSGSIASVEDTVMSEPNVGTVTRITALDNSDILDDRLVFETFDTAWTLHGVLTVITTNYTVPHGIYMDQSTGTGPSVSETIAFDGVTVRAALNYLSQRSGWAWRLTTDNFIQMFPAGSMTAGYSLTSSNSKIIGGVTWTKSSTSRVNTIHVKYGGTQRIIRPQTWTADGVASTFALDEPVALTADGTPETRGLVRVNGADETLGGTWTLNTAVTPNTITASYVPAAGAVIEFTYAVQFPQKLTEDNPTEVALHGIRERLLELPYVTDQAQARTQAQDELRKAFASEGRVVRIRTRELPLPLPGDRITITVPERTLSGWWLITEVRVRDVRRDLLETELTCIEGGEFAGSWVDYFRSAFGSSAGGGSSSGGSVIGGFAPALSGFFEDDVIAHVGESSPTAGTPTEVSMRGLVANASVAGPAHVAGLVDDDFSFATLADYLHQSPASPGWFVVNLAESQTYRYVFGFRKDAIGAAGTYYGVKSVPGSVYLGAPETWGWGPGYRINGIYTSALDVSDGLTERGRTTLMGESDTYTPVFGSTGGTAASLGNGSISGRYESIGKMKHVTIAFQVGSTTNAGTGNLWTFSLPTAAISTAFTRMTAMIVDNGSQVYTAVAYLASTTTIAVVNDGNTGAGIGAGVPFVWATGDTVTIDGWYLEA
jgi:hypothetical protein